jgi:hypothetical protein
MIIDIPSPKVTDAALVFLSVVEDQPIPVGEGRTGPEAKISLLCLYVYISVQCEEKEYYLFHGFRIFRLNYFTLLICCVGIKKVTLVSKKNQRQEFAAD